MARKTASEGRGSRQPTPIRITRRVRTVLIVLCLLTLALLMWFAPTVPVVLLGGFAVAMALSFPVRWLSYVMPRTLAILVTFFALLAAGFFAMLVLIPILIAQLASLVEAAPGIVRDASSTVRRLLEPLSELGILPGTPEQFMSGLGQDLVGLAQDLARQTLGGLATFVSGAIGIVLTLFGVVFVAVYLLANVRRLKATYLASSPKSYRRDASQLWDSFSYTFSRYLSGLALDMFLQGAISAVGLFFLGVPYALLLGAWVSVSAIIPYLGAWLGAIPAVIVAFTVSPLTAVLTAVFFLIVQQLEGNVLQPRIQGSALHMPSILIFLAVIAGGQIAGLLGVVFAVPALAALKVLFDFFRARLVTDE